jgi:hypothetical protein
MPSQTLDTAIVGWLALRYPAQFWGRKTDGLTGSGLQAQQNGRRIELGKDVQCPEFWNERSSSQRTA